MRKINFNKAFILTLALFLLIVNLYSQNIECPPSNGEIWTSSDVVIGLGHFGDNLANVNFEYYWEDDFTASIKIDWTTFVNSSDFITDDIAKKILEQNAVNSLVNVQGDWSGYITVYYETECKSVQKVAVDIETESEFLCCDEGGGQATEDWHVWLDNDGVTHKLLYHEKLVSCGYKCCARRYLVETEYNSVDEKWQSYIVEEAVTLSITDCDCTETFYDCVTGDPVPCTGDCGE